MRSQFTSEFGKVHNEQVFIMEGVVIKNINKQALPFH